jgi:hypothetical protein
VIGVLIESEVTLKVERASPDAAALTSMRYFSVERGGKLGIGANVTV